MSPEPLERPGALSNLRPDDAALAATSLFRNDDLAADAIRSGLQHGKVNAARSHRRTTGAIRMIPSPTVRERLRSPNARSRRRWKGSPHPRASPQSAGWSRSSPDSVKADRASGLADQASPLPRPLAEVDVHFPSSSTVRSAISLREVVWSSRSTTTVFGEPTRYGSQSNHRPSCATRRHRSQCRCDPCSGCLRRWHSSARWEDCR